ncbi:MAG: hypothetical protein V1767_05830 [Chloroflexota bacterium]
MNLAALILSISFVILPQPQLSAYCQASTVACYNYSHNRIALDENLSGTVLQIALAHEIGHALTRNATLEEYRAVWGDKPIKELREDAAWSFTWLAWFPQTVSEREKQFFIPLLLEN